MNTLLLRPAEPERDFGQLAAWFTILEDEPNTETSLKEYYGKEKERIIKMAAEDENGELLGFYWALRDRLVADQFSISLFVQPVRRCQGVGRRLYSDLIRACKGVKKLHVNVWDNCPECRAFAERRGFTEKSHRIAMALDLDSLDDQPYDEIISGLKGEGFQFTSMEQLGNTEEAQRKLYTLNDSTSISDPGADGEHPWASFEDFQQRVCRSDWYKPGGQMVVIDTATGAWAAMSAITCFQGTNYAYNLFTGVDMPYRGRKLAQAVKMQALCYARDVLQAHVVRTHHMEKNLPMIAIDRKLGYTQMPGTFLMEKIVEE
jgi:GNAT superfamily N-acetyltransferase/RimJ/RimL family protein N-acetyltransferase